MMNEKVAGVPDTMQMEGGNEAHLSPKRLIGETAVETGAGIILNSSDSGIDFLNDAMKELTHNESSENETQAEYIVDPTARVTYMKGKFLGKGGFARVHELIDLNTNSVYAGKIIPKNRIVKKQHMQKIAREILIHKSLKHDHVVGLINFFEDPSKAFMVLENCPMQSLVHVLKYRKSLTDPEVRYYLKQLVSAVVYIHSQGIIHRDLKPGNMLLTENMVVKVGDFGLAIHANTETRVMICGTPNYIAPEVLKKQSCGYESDVWAIGCIMYTLLVGKPPFETETLKETYSRIVENHYFIPGHLLHTAHFLIRMLLHPMPDHRLQLAEITEQMYIQTGFTPQVLSTACCYTAPMFPMEMESPIATASIRRARRCESSLCDPPPKVINISDSLIQAKDPAEALQGLYTFKASDVIPNKGDQLVPNRLEPSVRRNLTDQGAAALEVCTGNAAFLSQKLKSIFCMDACDPAKPLSNAGALYKNLSQALKRMPPSSECRTIKEIRVYPLFISKWIDYSNKYGFGFLLSDNSVGVLFNDGTKMSFTPDHRHVEFHDIRDKLSAHPVHSVPEALRNRFTLLNHFTRYMDENLTDGADLKMLKVGKKKCNVPYMKRWVRTSTSIIMELSTGTLQINFFKDHTKVIIHQLPMDYVLTYIDKDRQSRSFYLHHLAMSGCKPCVSERLRYAAAVLQEFAQLDGDSV